MKTKIGVSLVCDQIGELGRWVQAVEEAGFDRIGLGDSPALYPDTYVQCTVAALNSRSLKLGPRVTTPVNRDPLATAAAISAVDELAGGRALLGIGTGDSAAYSAGTHPATLAQTREYILALKDMFTQGYGIYQGKAIQFARGKRPIPIYLAASGPKALRLAGAICEGVIIGWGVQPDLVTLALDFLKQGADSTGRRVEEIDVWWLIGASIAENSQEALDNIKTHLAAQANQAFRLGVEGKGIPEQLLPRIQQLIASYNYGAHEKSGNVRLVEELGLTQYLADRFTIAGTPDQFAERTAELARWGANQLWFTMPVPDKMSFLAAVRQYVLPRLS